MFLSVFDKHNISFLEDDIIGYFEGAYDLVAMPGLNRKKIFSQNFFRFKPGITTAPHAHSQ